ncbi:hypothetical protein [Demequina sp. SO4-18]|uniref:hypothetical protein n=1 Tax=Demequina sp. SO4-18 TaxID=3401026 RepID=UPI003B5B6C6C
MTDESRPLSRRERRAQQAREAARPADDTDALGDAPISESIPTHSPEGRPLTRRERRRLERSRQPMETWTAEEEMIATGQIPAMTPERIAEQERIAREKAEQAQREAQGEARRAPEDLEVLPEAEEPPGDAESAVEDAGAHEPSRDDGAQHTDVEGTVGPHDDVQGEDAQHAERPENEDAQPLVFEPGPEPEAARDADSEPPTAFSPVVEPAIDAEPAPASAPEPESAPEEGAPTPTVPQRTSLIPSAADESTAPEPEPEPEPDAAVPDQASGDDEPHPGQETGEQETAEQESQDAPAESTESLLGMPAGMSPEMYDALFPPGSLQRRLMEQQATDQAAEAADEAPVEDPAAEIRHLTEQAVAGLDAASSRRSASAPEIDDPAAEAAANAILPNAWGPAASPVAPPALYTESQSADSPSADYQTARSPESGPSAASVPGGPSGLSAPSTHSAPSAQSSPGAWRSEPRADQRSQDAVPTAPEVSSEGPGEEPPVRIDQTPFDAILGDHPGTAALDEASHAAGERHRPAFHSVAHAQRQAESPATVPDGPAGVPDASAQLAPHYAAFDVPQWSTPTPEQAESSWSAHPLMRVDRPAPELPEVESAKDIPRPDLSSVRRPAFTPQTDGFPSIEPVPTGQIEVPPRERPELDAVGGPRHFKWAHLAVFGAVAFLLGVVVWNLTLRP